MRSPFQAIVDYERKHHIPSGWINYAISRSSPNGYWQRLERGEIKLDAAYFKGFNADLVNADLWKEYHIRDSGPSKKIKSVKEMAKPTQLEDPVGLKTESADSTPTNQDEGANSRAERPQDREKQLSAGSGKKRLKDLANPTPLGDSVSFLKAEAADSTPIDQVRFVRSITDGISPDKTKGSITQSKSSIPPLPSIDAEALFWEMMRVSREPDPYIFPALKKLKASNIFIIGALSNTVIYPPDHEYNTDRAEVRSQFDSFISSAHVGLRKPDRKIYDLAVKELDRVSKEKGGRGLKAGDIVFLDDIGENLKTGKGVGMQTIKVQLGKTWRAVEELEKVTAMDLMDAETRQSKL